MRARLLSVVLGVVLAACSQAASPTSVSYQIYEYSCCDAAALAGWQAGKTVTLKWMVTPAGQTTQTRALPVTLRATLTGPFASVDALKLAVTQHRLGSGVRVIQSSPIATTDRAGGTPTSQFVLPSDLAPGYYNLATETAYGSSVASGASIVVVGA